MFDRTRIFTNATARCMSLGLGLGLGLGASSGCLIFGLDCAAPWSEVETVDLGTTADMLAIAGGSEYDAFVLVGTGGTVAFVDLEQSSVSTPTNVPLRGVVGDDRTVVVGSGGLILSSDDRGASWEPRTSGTTDDLLAIARLYYFDNGALVTLTA
ncbi:MAG: hypothetical protein KC431_11225, partial [Myxococcales bacterium]|nr:hypothetical protein [Myxococcales bacterium]